jgi:hypothetical protein
VDGPEVTLETGKVLEQLLALVALERFFDRMRPQMTLESTRVAESLRANFALEGLVARVNAQMID